ncbi:MAG: hypothetical protein J6X78_00030 [Treponema sp.]|nr:hypothetical protein [Treponema sp.]
MNKGKIITAALMTVFCTIMFCSCSLIYEFIEPSRRTTEKNIKKLSKAWDKEYKDAYELLAPILKDDGMSSSSNKKIVLICTNDAGLSKAEKQTIEKAATEYNANIKNERDTLQSRLNKVEAELNKVFMGQKEKDQYRKEQSELKKRIEALGKPLTAAEIEGKYLEEITKFKKSLNEKNIVFVDRSQLEGVMKEHAFQLNDWSDENKTTELGHVLNAHGFITFVLHGIKINNNKADVDVVAEILDINTMQKNTITYSGDALKMFESVLTDVSQIPRIIKFDDIRQSAVEYTRDTLKYVTPFSRSSFAPKPAAPDDKISQTIANIDEIELDVESGSCYVRFLDGEEESGSLKMTVNDPRVVAPESAGANHKLDLLPAENVAIPYVTLDSLPINVDKGIEHYGFDAGDYAGKKDNMHFKVGGYDFYAVNKSTFLAGTIRIKTKSLNLSCNMYRNYEVGDAYIDYYKDGYIKYYGDQFVLDYKADNDDETGRHYFAFFDVVE